MTPEIACAASSKRQRVCTAKNSDDQRRVQFAEQ